MANDEDLVRIRQGVDVWNTWRAQNLDRHVDLSEADLSRAQLPRVMLTTNIGSANLHGTILTGAMLVQAELDGANLTEADLSRAYLYGAKLGTNPDCFAATLCRTKLCEAELSWANLSQANLCDADLSGAKLHATKLASADLAGANFHGTELFGTNFYNADLSKADLSGAILSETEFVSVDLSATKGLDKCVYRGPSIIDHRTLSQSRGVPLLFLRGCGLPDRLIDYLPSLLEEAIQYYSCFISYSSKDDTFAKRLHADLQDNGVRCWFAPHDLPIGAKHWDEIDAAIHVRDKLLLIASENSIASDWVEDEVTKAFAEERRRNQPVLFPVRIDDTIMRTDEPWAAKLRNQRHIGNFCGWKDHDAYREAFDRVLRDLKAPPKA